MTVNVETLPALDLDVAAPGAHKSRPVVSGLLIPPIGLILAIIS